MVAMVVYPAGMLTFHELALVRSAEATAGEARLSVTDEQGTTRQYRTVATHFEETVNWYIAYGSTEVWHVLNVTEDTHPFHVHLVQFQALSRDLYTKEGFQ
jgi:FtsP/CotA-like multicopper oxidase with cupredoxin domain